VIYLYAITDDAGAPLPEQSGLDDRPLAEVADGGVAAVLTHHSELKPAPQPDLLWKHEAVVEALMRDRAVLPMRFGTCLAGEHELRSLLDEQGGDFSNRLERVRDRVELGVRVIVGDQKSAGGWPAENGSDYMLQRLDAQRQTERLAQTVHAPLAELAECSSSNLAPGTGGDLTGSYLLRRAEVAAFIGRVQDLQERDPRLDITCTGPWPPYSFVDGERR
jgi:hypothetical protein